MITATNSTTPSVIQISWVPAKVRGVRVGGLVARSMRWIIARPRPLSAETMGSRIGSAYAREDADHDVAADDQGGQPGAVGEQVDREGRR